ncbi:hypothetical protein ACFX15_046231 [Malus domestica]
MSCRGIGKSCCNYSISVSYGMKLVRVTEDEIVGVVGCGFYFQDHRFEEGGLKVQRSELLQEAILEFAGCGFAA